MTKSSTNSRKRGRPRSNWSNSEGSKVLALDRGLTILGALARDGAATLGDLALQVGMPPSTVHRILGTLDGHGFVQIDEATQKWAVGIGAYRVGCTYLVRTNLIEAARKAMRALMEQTGETANLAIENDGYIVFVSQVETNNPIRAFHRPGTRSHMHASGIGKILLAHMAKKDIKTVLQKVGLPEFTANTLTSAESLFDDLKTSAERGWAFDDEERYDGMRCVAAPIINSFGEVIAGLSVSGPANRFSNSSVPKIGLAVRAAADAVTQTIGGKAPVPGPRTPGA